MFSFCSDSKIKSRPRPRRQRQPRQRGLITVYTRGLTLTLTLLVSAPLEARAEDGVGERAAQRVIENRHIRHRIELMNTQRATMERLIAMAAGRHPFDAQQAQADRRILIKTTRLIPKRFRKPRLTDQSHALPVVWHNWESFQRQAETAREAAKAISPRTLPALRRTMPAMMQACISCHEGYREPANEFTTH